MASKKTTKNTPATTTDTNDTPANVVTLMLAPNEIKADNTKNGRKYQVNIEDVKKRAVSMAVNGQLQAIEVVKTAKGYELEFGYTRYFAAVMLRDGFDFDNKHYKNPDFKLRCNVSETKTAKVRFLRNISENIDRNELSDIDIAYNIARMRTTFKMTQTEIAKTFGFEQSKISRLDSLNNLPEKLQQRVHDKEISTAVGVELVKPANGLTENEMLHLCNDREITVAKIQEYVRNKTAVQTPANPDNTDDSDNNDGKDNGNTNPPERKRTLSQIQNELENYVDPNNFRITRIYCSLIVGFIKGSVSPAEMEAAISQVEKELRAAGIQNSVQ